jgi:hypothetical protein
MTITIPHASLIIPEKYGNNRSFIRKLILLSSDFDNTCYL